MGNIEIAEVLRGWRAELEATGRAPGTITLRMSHARRFLTSTDKPLRSIRRGDVSAWMAAQSWGPSARASARASLRGLWAWLLAEGYVSEDIMAGTPPVRRPRAVPRPMPDALVLEAIHHAPDDLALAIEIMATCGLRRAECARVRSDDVEPVGRGWQLRVTGKGGHERLVPMPGPLARRVRARGGYILPGYDHGHISPGWLGKRLRGVLPAGWTPHKLRHRYATCAYHESRDVRAVQSLLGHASLATTQVYVGVDDEATRAAARAAWTICAA